VTSALNFDTPDCHVTGGCDLYTTKAAGSDKKLYKNIDKSLESQHEALLKLGASLSPPQREEMAISHNLSRSSPFGNLGDISSRRTFAYLIATLNASHPDYDFSHVLRPADFKRERNLRRVMSSLDNTLGNVRPSSLVSGPSPRSFGTVGVLKTAVDDAGASTSPLWGPVMWAKIDKEMTLKDCTVFAYQPADNPFDEEEGAIWSYHYFFFNKTLKRVAYLYVRAVPVVSHSPTLRPRRTSGDALLSSSLTKRSRLSVGTLGRGSGGASKRARYWLGDSYAERITQSEDDDDDFDDGLHWNRGADGEIEDYCDDDGFDDFDDDDVDEDDDGADDRDGDDDDDRARKPRGVSEDIAARMEIE